MLWLQLTLRPSGLNSWYPEVCSVLEFLEYPRMFGSVSQIEKKSINLIMLENSNVLFQMGISFISEGSVWRGGPGCF